jgi:AbrB family looped-hinge helix DNA binding protein
MAKKITIRGQVTVPKRVRDALGLSAGDAVEFQLNGNGEFVLRKVPTSAPAGRRGSRRGHPRVVAQMRRRAAELLELLRGLD